MSLSEIEKYINLRNKIHYSRFIWPIYSVLEQFSSSFFNLSIIFKRRRRERCVSIINSDWPACSIFLKFPHLLSGFHGQSTFCHLTLSAFENHGKNLRLFHTVLFVLFWPFCPRPIFSFIFAHFGLFVLV